MEFRLLGPLEASRAGTSIPLGGPKQRAVLTHLLLRRNQLVPADRLIDEVWGDQPPTTVRSALQVYVSHLRSALGPDRLEGRQHGYVLHAGDSEIDAMRFEQLVDAARRVRVTDPAAAAGLYADALSLWRGHALDDLAQQPSLRPEIARLEALRMTATEEQVAAELDLGRHAELLPQLQTLTASHPLSERLWGHLMVALYRCGRQGDALAAFHRARNILDEELGVEPSPELQRVQQLILRQDPSLEVTGQPLRGYRLLDRLGEGTSGVVHRAFQPQVNREVAVRVIHPDLVNNADFIRRFEVEAQAVASLEHPHVVPLYDYWREPDGAYLVMRLLRGGSLRQLLDRGPLDVATAATVIDQVSLALAAAHRQGVIHNNIKPENILFDEEGNAYLSDFGVADGPTGARRESRGETPGPSTDVYQLGLVASELLGGRHPAVDAVVAVATAPAASARYDDGAALAAALRGAFDAAPVATPETPVEVRNPYRGLLPFLESDAGDFFGRDVLVNRLLANLADHAASRLMTVVGPSGSGKSSVVRAGLLPALRNAALPRSDSWFVVEMVPGRDPFSELQAALLQVAARPLPPNLADRLAEGAGDSITSAAQWVLSGDTAELVLVIDQFEELFTLVDDEDVRTRFIAGLVAAVASPRSRVRVVATLRADFYDKPLRYPGLAQLVDSGSVAVAPLTAEELERAVVGPAERVGVIVDPGLAAQIVADVTDQPGALPLLQYALTELFERRSGSALSSSTYRAIGGVAGALARRADEIFVALSDDAQRAGRQLFLRLVTPGESSDDTRRRVLRSELLSLDGDAAGMTAAIDSFGQARLLSFDRDPATREPTVEVAHEALLREWERVRGWIDDAGQDLRTQRWLATAAREWTHAGRDESFLTTGSRLQQLEDWQQRAGLAATPEEREYLAASAGERDRLRADEEARREKELFLERRSFRRLRALVAVLAVAALVAGGLTVYASNQGRLAQREARIASARAFAAAATASLETDPERGMLLALAAVDRTRAVDGIVLPEAEEALHQGIVASRMVASFEGVLGGALDWSPDGRLFVTEGPEFSGLVDIRDAENGERVRMFRGHVRPAPGLGRRAVGPARRLGDSPDVTDVVFSADGSLLATTGDDGAARVWNPATGENVASFQGEGAVWGPAFSPDGSLLSAAWPGERLIRVQDTRTGRTIHEIGSVDGTHATAFSPDGARFAFATGGESARTAVVRVLDSTSAHPAFALRGHEGHVRDIDWSPDGRWIATTSVDRTARIWDAHDGRLRFTLHGHAAALSEGDWSPDSTRLVTAGEEGTAKVWAIGEDGAREVVSLSTHERHGGVLGVAFSPDGDRVMTGNVDITAVRIWDVSLAGDAEWANLPGDPGGAGGVAFSRSNRRVLASTGNAIAVWDLDSGRRLRTLARRAGPIHDIAAGDGTPIVTAGGRAVIAWDSASGDEVFRLPGGHANWNADGTLLAVAGNDRVTIVDRSGREVANLPEEEHMTAAAVQFSPDGRLVATARGPTGAVDPDGGVHYPRVKIWDWRRGTVESTISTAAEAIAFDPRGEQLVTAGHGGVPAVWDITTGVQRRTSPRARTEPGRRHGRLGGRSTTFVGHVGDVHDVAYSADAALLATAGSDGTVRLWHTDSGERALVLRGHTGPVRKVRFSSDRSRLVSSAEDGTVRVWALNLDDVITLAHNELTRTLTDEECRRFMHVESCPD